MSEQLEGGAADRAALAMRDGVPSSALIDKVLRALPDAPGAVLDDATVEQFSRRLQEAAHLLSDFPLTSNPIDRAESFRYLLSMMAYAVDAGLLNADPLEPMFSPPYRLHLLDWGAASPDSVYRRAMVRDDRAYRVHGRFGNAKYFSFDFRQAASPRTLTPDDVESDTGGEFEMFIGGSAREHNWWAMPSGTNGLVVREFFDDWLAAQRSRLRIDCLDGEIAARVEHRPDRVAAEFDVVGQWILDGGVRYWMERSISLAARAENSFLPELNRDDTKLPVTNFGWWRLAPDQALIVELDDPEAEFWGLHLATSLWHTLDYANRLTTHNQAQSACDRDGTYRFVVSAADPGVFNWLDTTGLECGVLVLRFHRAANAHPPRTRLVNLSDLDQLLPTSRRCVPAERREQLAARREGVAHLICD